MKIKIRYQLTFTYILVIFLTIALTGGLFLHWLRNFLLENIEKNLSSQGNSLAKMLSGYAWDEKDLSQAAFFFTENFQPTEKFTFKIYDLKGYLIATSEEEPVTDIDGKIFLILKDKEKVKWFREVKGEKIMHITVPVNRLKKIIGFIDVSSSLSEIEHIFSMMIRILSIAIIFSVIFVSIIGFILARTVTEPVNRIKDIAVKISQGDLKQRIKPVKNPAELGELAHTINHMADQLKTFIDELTGEKNKINAILTNVIDGLIAIDPAGKIIFLNSTAEKKLNRKSEKLIDRALKEIWPEQKFLNLVEETIKNKTLVRKEITTKTEPLEILDFTLAPFQDERDENQGIMIVFRDITALRKLETIRSEFLSNVSHELRTPLTIIKGFCVTLMDEPDDKELLEHSLKTIEQETDRLSRLVNDILELSKLRSQKLSLRIEKNNITELLTQILKEFSLEAVKSNIKISYNLPEKPAEMNFDRDRIKQVLINLFDNAIKYTPPEGDIKVEGGLNEKKNKFKIKIINSGEGIPEEEIPHIFERYFRAKNKVKKRGTGLGLTIAKEIINAHGGEINIKNIKDGLEVSFWLYTEPALKE